MAVTGNAGATKVIRCAAGFVATKYRIVSADDGTTVVIGPITTGITTTGTLRYKATATMPNAGGDYEIQWDDGSNTWAGTEDLTVNGDVNLGTNSQLKPPIHS